jgi:hypothetical protein
MIGYVEPEHFAFESELQLLDPLIADDFGLGVFGVDGVASEQGILAHLLVAAALEGGFEQVFELETQGFARMTGAVKSPGLYQRVDGALVEYQWVDPVGEVVKVAEGTVHLSRVDDLLDDPLTDVPDG